MELSQNFTDPFAGDNFDFGILLQDTDFYSKLSFEQHKQNLKELKEDVFNPQDLDYTLKEMQRAPVSAPIQPLKQLQETEMPSTTQAKLPFNTFSPAPGQVPGVTNINDLGRKRRLSYKIQMSLFGQPYQQQPYQQQPTSLYGQTQLPQTLLPPAQPPVKKAATSSGPQFPTYYRHLKEKPCPSCLVPVARFQADEVQFDLQKPCVKKEEEVKVAIGDDNKVENVKLKKEAPKTNMYVPITLSEGNGCRHWTVREETFLIGIIFDILYKRGSLAPTKAQRKVNDICWDRIKKIYDIACIRYALLTRSKGGVTSCTTRTLHAIVRHFKVMKSNLNEVESDQDSDEEPLFKKLHRGWQDEYNQGKILTCSEKKFKLYVEQMKTLSSHTCSFMHI